MEKLSCLIVNYITPIICGFTAANMYYVQPLTPIISSELMIPYVKASMLYSFSLIGNALSLFFIIPLGDFYNKRLLITLLYTVSTLALLIFYITINYYILSIAAFLIGIGTSAIPLITAGLSKQNDGTRLIGRIMACVLVGILFSRFLSSLLCEMWGWKSIYVIATMLMFLSSLLLFINYPEPQNRKLLVKESYSHILYLNISSVLQNTVIMQYCLSAFIIMFLFSAFWSNVSIYLSSVFHLSQSQIGFFSLTGIAGASSALLSPMILEKINYKDNALYFLIVVALVIMGLFRSLLAIAVIGALLIDAMIQLIHINNQRGLFISCKGNEARAASCYMTSFVTGGAVGGFLSSYLYSLYGWNAVLISCAIITLIPMFIKLRENVNEKY
ncbi:MFS transporter [Escherichia coli]|uniref:MFS transporter n=1 Tax=Klebsiella sp. RHBSTW-00465 TaxID=2742650 RepID=UPI0015F527FD|nr:MFS transporter [Klebsiella sp. RHBSTW-00465]EEQ3637101.1 MFS transporter [Escherichia coli]MBA7847840.1 MFS transporter [Klebsiella sp. RHBSTW-00465]HEM8644044.1 MFS transporter [Klebsiella aerogenes]